MTGFRGGLTGPALGDIQPWVVRLARLGFAAKGVIYLIMGLLALRAAIQRGGQQPTNTQGALEVILREPFGRFLLAIVAVGLLGYALWRLTEAFFDPEHLGARPKGALTRVGYAISGLAYGGLAYTAWRLVTGAAIHRGNWAAAWTARILSLPLGQFLVGIAGIAIIGVGLYGLYCAYAAPFLAQMDLSGLSPEQRRGVEVLGRLGNAARGVVFGIIGGYVLRAAVTFNPHQVRGLQGAQTSIQHHPGGALLLGLVALGLVAYGVFMFAEARSHRVRLPSGLGPDPH